MKLLTYFSLLLLAASPVHAVQKHGDTNRKEKAHSNESSKRKNHKLVLKKKKDFTKETDASEYSITQKSIGTTGLVITKPGKYFLSEDIFFSPKSNTTAALTIASSNVTIDLSGRKLVQTTAKTSTIGIVVAKNIQSIEFLNGSIENFGALGMWVSTGVKGVLIDSVTISNCGNTGHAPYATQDSFQEHGLGFFAGSLGLGGKVAHADQIVQVEIKNCFFNNTLNNESTAFDALSGNDVGVISVGIGAACVSDLLVENCKTSAIMSTHNTARGFSLTDGVNTKIVNHQATDILHSKDGAGILLSKVTGSSLHGIHVNTIRDLGGVDLIQHGSRGVAVIHSKNSSLQNCFVTEVINTSLTGIAHGIDICSSINTLVTGAQVFDCSGIAAGVSVAGIAYSTAIGITPAPLSPSTTDKGGVFVDCESTGNTSISGKAYGFSVASFQSQASPMGSINENGIPKAVIINRCNAENNTTSGFRFHNASNCSLLNSITKNNGHYGILFDQSGNSMTDPVACSIENNVIETNGTTGFDAGVQDYYAIQNIYIGNKAFNNSPVNYAGVVQSTPMIVWNVPVDVPQGAINQPFANLDAQSH